MPYKTNKELPDSVKKALPSKAQEIFRKAFNSAVSENDEESAFKIAWAAVEKAGYKKEGDKWIKESLIEEEQELIEFATSFSQLEAEQQAAQRAMEIESLTSSFLRLVENIMCDMIVEDKIGAIRQLTDEFTDRLGAIQEMEMRKKIRENEENAVELAESELSPITKLSESDSGPLRAIVRIIRPGWGNKRHNHYYPKDVLQRDAFRFVGAKMYETDHRPDEKSTRTWVSTIEDIVGFDDGAPLAKVAVHDENFADRLRNLNELEMLPKMECSIYASGLAKGGFKINGREGKQVESITKVSSVDWVTRAGAGGAAVSLVENEGVELGVDSNNKENDMETKPNEIQEEEIQTEEVEEIEIEESEEQEPEKLLSIAEVKDVLAQTELPQYAQTRLAFTGRFSNEDEIKEAAEAELEYIKTVTHSGKPFGMSKQVEKKPENVDKFAEAESEKDKLVRGFMQIKSNKE